MRPLPVLCLLLLAGGHAVAAGARLHVTLKESAGVEGARVTLASVLAPDAAALPALRPLLSADLGAAPLPGYALRLGRADIARRLRARHPGAELDWSGADAVRVERLASPFDGAALVGAAEAHLRRQLAPLGARLELRPAQRPPELQLPAGAVELRPRALNAHALHPEMTVWVDILVDGLPFRAVAVPFRVAAFARVLAGRGELGAGIRPGCADLDVIEADIARLESLPLAADCTRVAGQLKRRLGPRSPLLASHMLVPAAVTQGEQVMLRVTQGAIELESRAVALMSGEIGQPVEVRAASSKHPIRAEVVAPGVVALTKR